MDVFRLRCTIADHRPHSLISSFPIAVRGKNDDVRVVWFTFDIPYDEEDEDESADVEIVTYKACCMDSDYNVQSADFEVEEIIQYEVTEEPELDYNKYMLMLCEMIEAGSFDEAAVRGLLARSEQFYVADLSYRAAELFDD